MDQRKREEYLKERDRLARLKIPGEIKPGSGKIPEEFWEMPWPEDPEGLARRALIEDRRRGR